MTNAVATSSLKPAVPDQNNLRRLGGQVRRRLEANPAVYSVTQENAEIYAVGDFMTAEECDRMIAMIDVVARPSAVFDLTYGADYRTSYSGDVDAQDPFVRKISRRIDDLLGIDGRWGETIQGQRYLPGQQFQPHNDWFWTEAGYWEREKNNGGQRSWTAMVYLNDVEDGGSTDFVKLGLSIAPKKGVLLIWNNADLDGVPNEYTQHAGTPVKAGVKYVITRWYRTRRWG